MHVYKKSSTCLLLYLHQIHANIFIFFKQSKMPGNKPTPMKIDKFFYIKSSHYQPTDESNPHHKGYELVVDGLIFKNNRSNTASTNWLCKEKGCKGSVTLSFSDDIDRSNEHTISKSCHSNCYTPIVKVKKDFKDDLKTMIRDNGGLALGPMYQEVQNRVVRSSDFSMKELGGILPRLHHIRNGLEKMKRKHRGAPPLPESIEKIVLDVNGKYTKTNDDKVFLIDSGAKNSHLTFCSEVGLEVLAKSDQWFSDGTFRTAAKYFYQL
jgi:hypothetical protein